ncbi:MAG: immune inhibitor A domain-containing protein, partial [Bacilli bacterium]
PIWFTNSNTYITSLTKKANVLSDIQAAYFGTTSQTGWNSVETFYDTESKSALSLEGTVSDWYECGQSSTSYYSDSTGGDNTISLVQTASDWYFANHTSESRTDYDRDGNGYLDGVMLIYGAPDYRELADDNASNLWAYCFWIQDGIYPSSTNPGPNVFFWASYDFMYSATTALLRAGSSYGGGDTSHCSIDAHTYIHEMGHVFGLDDYYDYSGQYSPAAGFSMQDYNVGGHDPFSVMALGWASPYIPTESCSITINDFQSSHDLILLTPNWNSYNSPFDEYLLLELYTPTGLNEFDSDYSYSGGYPQGPSVPGIRLWHIDARLTAYLSGGWSTTLTSNTMGSYIYTAMSNTYYTEESSSYASVLGQSYGDYNLLQLIRNSTSTNYYPTANLTSSNLFKAGSSFSMSTFYRQFVGGENLNSGASLGWSFTVESCSLSSATISLTRAA